MIHLLILFELIYVLGFVYFRPSELPVESVIRASCATQSRG